MAITNFYYLTTDILDRIRNESQYLTNGGNQEFDTESINMDDVGFITTRLEEAANDIFVMLHKWSGIDLITAEDLATLEITKPFVINGTVPNREGDYIAYWMVFPANFDENLVTAIDLAIKKSLVDKTLYKWFDAIGRRNEYIDNNEEKSTSRLRSLLNFRTRTNKQYRYY